MKPRPSYQPPRVASIPAALIPGLAAISGLTVISGLAVIPGLAIIPGLAVIPGLASTPSRSITHNLVVTTSQAALPVPARLLVAAGKGAPVARPALASPPQFLPVEARWCLPGGRCIGLEVPRGERQFSFGLQLRPALPTLRGMWFDFGSPTLARFWMHRTPEPLDMLFIRDQRVVAIEAKTKPCMHLPCRAYGPDELVESVVELAAGQAEALGLKVGSEAAIELKAPD